MASPRVVYRRGGARDSQPFVRPFDSDRRFIASDGLTPPAPRTIPSCMPLGWALLAVPVLIALNAFFVAAEYAVVAVRPGQIESLRRRGKRAAAAAIGRLKANPASAIGTIQVCITMTNLMLGWIGEPAVSALLHNLFGPAIRLAPAVMTGVSTALSFLVVTLLTVVLSELLPKALTLRYAEPVASLTAVPVLAIQQVARPLVWLMNAIANAVTRPLGLGSVEDMEGQRVTAEELKLMATQAADDGVLTPRERALVLNSLALGRRKARHVMVPRLKVVYLDLRRSMEENRRVMDEFLYTRLPLCDGGLDHVLGIVHTKEFLSAYGADTHRNEGDSKVLSLLSRPPVFALESTPLDRLLVTFRERKSEMVFLVDEFGGVEGIVTQQDVVDELVGGVGEEKGSVVPAAGGVAVGEVPQRPPDAAPFVIPGDTPVYDLARCLGRPELGAAASAVTVNGLIVASLGRLPKAGEAVEVDGVGFHVIETDGRTIRFARVMPGAAAGASPTPDPISSST